MTQSSPKLPPQSKLPPPLVPFGIIVKALRSDPQALAVLIACTLAISVTGLEPAYLSLGTDEIQSQLRTPASNAPMYVALVYLVLAVLTLVAGTTGDLFGRKLMLIVGLIGVTLSNVVGALTLGTPFFVAADVLNSISSVMVVPMTVAIVTLAFKPMVRPFAYGMLFGFLGLALVVGPTLGGIFEERGTPALAFLPVIVAGPLAIWLVPRAVLESRTPRALRRTSAVLNLVLLAGIFVLVYLVVTMRAFFQNWMIVLIMGGALILTVVFGRRLIRRSRYFSGVELYTSRDVGLAILAGIVLSAGQSVFFYQMAAFFQDVQKVGPVITGLRLAPFVLGLLAGSFLIARLALRFGARRLIVGGLVFMGLGLVGLSVVQVQTPYWVLLVPITLLGFGFGLAVPARTQVVLSAPPSELVGSAAAVNAAAGQSGYALGVILSSVLITQFANSIFLGTLKRAGASAALVETLSTALSDVFRLTSESIYPQLPDTIANLVTASYASAFTAGLGQTFVVFSLLMFLTSGIVFFFMRRGLKAAQAVPAPPLDKQENLPL